MDSCAVSASELVDEPVEGISYLVPRNMIWAERRPPLTREDLAKLEDNVGRVVSTHHEPKLFWLKRHIFLGVGPLLL